MKHICFEQPHKINLTEKNYTNTFKFGNLYFLIFDVS